VLACPVRGISVGCLVFLGGAGYAVVVRGGGLGGRVSLFGEPVEGAGE